MLKQLEGTYTALTTPFRDGGVDYGALATHVERQMVGGVDGLVPCGTTGEAPALTMQEHRRVLECVVRTANGRIPVIAGAGLNTTAKTVELAKLSEDCGVDGLLIVAPYYNKPSQVGLHAHFAAVAAAVSLPVILYNIPGRCGVEIAPDTIRALDAECENIIGVKHATGQVLDAAGLLAESRIRVLSGDDPLTLPLMSMGAVGVVSVVSNIAPRTVKRLTSAALQGDFGTARRAHGELLQLSQALLSLDTNPVPVKTAMALRGWCQEEFRLPLCPLAPEKRERLRELLAQTNPS